MHRFFVDPDRIAEGMAVIIGEDFKHITKVLRLGKGDRIELCDGRGTDYTVILNAPEAQSISGVIETQTASSGETPDFRVTLFQGLPKGDKMELIIQKSVELGVFEIVPYLSARTVTKIKDKKEKKTKRWQRIAYEAAKQSKRGIVPVVQEPCQLWDVQQGASHYDLLLLAYEDERKCGLKAALMHVKAMGSPAAPLNIGVLVGPEGGFDPEEVAACKEAGAVVVSLGKRILRTETAGMVMLAQLNFWREDRVVSDE